MSDDSDMQVFAAVMAAGSFAGAAKALDMTPSGVSRRIGRLEERLGVRLLNRTTRSLSLTDAGTRYHTRALQIIRDIEQAEREASDLQAVPRGLLRITSGNAYGAHRLIPMIPDFVAANPEVEVELTLTDRIVDLVSEGFDIAFRTGEPPDSSLMARRLAGVDLVTAAAPAYLDRHGHPETPEDLVHHNCLIRHLDGRRFDRWRFDGPEGPIAVRVKGSMAANNVEVLCGAAQRGLGIVRAARFVMDRALEDGRLVVVLPEYDAQDTRPMRMLYASNRQLSPKVRAFIDFAATYWKANR